MPRFLVLFLLLACATACTPPELKPSAIRRTAAKHYPNLADTAQLGLTRFSPRPGTTWWVVYNRFPDTARLLFYRSPKNTPLYRINYYDKPPCAITNVRVADNEGDGSFDLWVELLFDYGVSYQRRETHLYRHPFDPDLLDEVLEVTTFETWNHVETFDTLDNPQYKNNIYFDAALLPAASGFTLEGTIAGKRDEILEYAWDSLLQRYVPAEERKLLRHPRVLGAANGVARGGKILRRVDPWRPECQTYQLLDAKARPLPLPAAVGQALECTDVAGLSPQGRYLVYEDSARAHLCLYDTEAKKTTVLLRYAAALEGVSQIVWSPSGKRFATVIVNHEELPDDTAILLFELLPDGRCTLQKRPAKVRYDCAGHRCAAIPGQDFRFEGENAVRYRSYRQEVDERAGWNLCRF